MPPLNAVVIPVTPFRQNCSLIWCTKTGEGALVDPGGEPERLIEAAAEHGVKLTKILVTHGHIDHAGAVADLAERLDLPVEGPAREDRFWIDQLAQQGARFGFTGARPFEPDRWLADGDTVTLGDLELQVRHCPGHTPGHVIFFQPESRLALVGDVLFRGSVGRTDFPKGDHEQLIRSIRERLWPLGADVTFVPGHGDLSTFGTERQSNPYVADLMFDD